MPLKTNRRTRRRKTRSRKVKGGVRFFHFSHKPISDLQDIPDKNVGSYMLKPKGLWLSEDDAWQSWCAYSDYCNVGKLLKYEATVHISKLLIIDSVDSLNRFQKKYGTKSGINWEKVAHDYPGIYFTNYDEVKYQTLSGFSTDYATYWFQAVDLNSACVWRPSEVITKFELISGNI